MAESSKQTIACVIPSTLSRRSYEHLAQCIVSLQTSLFKTTLTIVTNSTNFSSKRKIRYIDQVLSNPNSYGFSELNNVAIEQILKTDQPEYILFINDDAWVNTDFFVNLLSVLKKQNADIIIPYIFDQKRKIVDSYGVEYFRSGYAKNNTKFGIPTTLATAACLIVRTKFLQKLKKNHGFYFNPLLYFYLEDVEFSIRAQMDQARFIKDRTLLAFHLGSTSSGKKSYFTMYQTYRNIIWVIILTWPLQYIFRHLLSILVVQAWVLFYSSFVFGPSLYIKLISDTISHWSELMQKRKKIVSSYTDQHLFGKIFSSLSFRTYHGVKIKVS